MRNNRAQPHFIKAGKNWYVYPYRWVGTPVYPIGVGESVMAAWYSYQQRQKDLRSYNLAG